MAAHKYWRALRMASATPDTLELSEFHLYYAGSRVDAAATLTASASPTGALANLKDGNTGTGCYWATGGSDVVLTWTFPSPQAVDAIVVGARTTIARWPTAVQLQGGDVTTGTGPSPEYTERQFYGLGRFVSAAKTALLAPVASSPVRPLQTRDLYLCAGIGRVPFDVVREVLPATTPKTYTPQWAKVRLCRDIDGRVVREMWSDPATGLGAFENVDENLTYTVTAIYPDSSLRAVIADRIKPEGYPA